jgi:hypothetical protein
MDTFYEAVGAIHLHSDFSDGSLPIPEIAGLAAKKGLDFLMFSDHNTLEPKHQGLEGWYDDVVVLIGCEINDPDDRNHYLAFRIDEEVEEGHKASEYVHEVKQRGGFGVIAHPAEKRNFSEAYPPYPWTDWDVDGFDGIEIWNQMSEWMEGITRRNWMWRILHPLRSIRYPVWETLERWDRLNRIRRVVGLGGIDVHAQTFRVFGIFPMEIYPYKVQFKSIRTHVLTRRPLYQDESCLSFQEADQEIFEALTAGRCFVSNFRVGDGRGFHFWVEGNEGTFPMGSRVKQHDTMFFHVQSPLPGKMYLLKDGRQIQQIHGNEMIYKTRERGVFRVEIFRKKRGWIYSNPIVIE